jgi:Protein involved in formate dehydrogenase formation
MAQIAISRSQPARPRRASGVKDRPYDRPPIAAEPWTDRRRRTLELRRRYFFAAELLDLYGALLPAQEHAYEEAISSRPSPGELVAYVAEVVMPAIIDVSVAAGPGKLREAVRQRLETTRPVDIVAGWMQGDDQVMLDRYLARASLGPVLEALGPEHGATCTGPRDASHCPQCGGPPQLSFVARAGEDLATGRRHLLCARCSASWGYARMTCAGCGEDSSSRLPIFNEEGTTSGERGSVVRGLPANQGEPASAVFTHIRIDACETCRRYLLNIDIASDPKAVPLVDELAALPLDLYARDQGFSKITPNLMGF